jgi:carbon-monoxide dehydrogenase small subunit
MHIRFTLNDAPLEIEAPPGMTLLRLLRERLNLTGTKPGCGEGECGACTVLIDGEPCSSCLTTVATIEGRSVITIEGLADGSALHPVQLAFVNEGAVQCGYCTPGMVLAAKALLDKNPDPTEQEIREGLSGNLCRCTGYGRIVAAVQRAARELRGPEAWDTEEVVP